MISCVFPDTIQALWFQQTYLGHTHTGTWRFGGGSRVRSAVPRRAFESGAKHRRTSVSDMLLRVVTWERNVVERQGKSNSRIRGLSFPGRSACLRCVWVNAGASRHRTALRPFPSRAFELLINAGPAAPTGLLLKRGIAPGSVPVSVAGGPAHSHQGPRVPIGLREALRCDLVSDECKTGSRR